MTEKNPYRTLGETLDFQEAPARAYKVMFNNNMGNRTLLIRLPMYEFFTMSDIASDQNINVAKNNVSQRQIDTNHAHKLANYILKGLVFSAINSKKTHGLNIPLSYNAIQNAFGTQPYISIQPLVCNLRNCERDGSDLKIRDLKALTIAGAEETAAYEVLLSQKHIFWVIDGQHRRKAIQFVFEFLEQVLSTHIYPNKKAVFPVTNKKATPDELLLWKDCNEIARSYCSLVAEVHLGLNPEEERQLFHDLNNLGKRVEVSLALEFDRGNPVNTFVQDQLIDRLLAWPIARKDISNWHDDDGSITRKDLMSINTRLILNTTNPRGATPAEVESKIPTALEFWKIVQSIPDIGKPGAKATTVAAQPVVLKALAKLTYDFAFGRSKNSSLLKKLFDGIPNIDFSHDNPIWRYYQMDEEERKQHDLEGLEEYLPDDSTQETDYNRDIGGYDLKSGLMRFGAKHNDIYPILGDMIRWQLGLPSRHANK